MVANADSRRGSLSTWSYARSRPLRVYVALPQARGFILHVDRRAAGPGLRDLMCLGPPRPDAGSAPPPTRNAPGTAAVVSRSWLPKEGRGGLGLITSLLGPPTSALCTLNLARRLSASAAVQAHRTGGPPVYPSPRPKSLQARPGGAPDRQSKLGSMNQPPGGTSRTEGRSASASGGRP